MRKQHNEVLFIVAVLGGCTGSLIGIFLVALVRSFC